MSSLTHAAVVKKPNNYDLLYTDNLTQHERLPSTFLGENDQGFLRCLVVLENYLSLYFFILGLFVISLPFLGSRILVPFFFDFGITCCIFNALDSLDYFFLLYFSLL
jgi:hypothetical protein